MFDQLSLWSSPFGKLLLDNVPMHEGMEVLDVGCGAGFPILELAHRLGNSSKLTGLDSWTSGLARAQWKADQMGLQNVDLIFGDGAKMPFGNDQFNLIVSNLGVNNFDNPEATLHECHRVLKRMGKLCLTTNLKGHFREFYSSFESTLKELGMTELLPKLHLQEQHRGTDESVRELIENAGFSILKMVKDRFHMRFVDGSALLNHLLIIIGFLPGWRSILPEKDEKQVFAHLEKKLNEQAKWNGELKMTVPMLYVETVK